LEKDYSSSPNHSLWDLQKEKEKRMQRLKKESDISDIITPKKRKKSRGVDAIQEAT